MLRVFCGKTTDAVRDAAHAWVQQYEDDGYEVMRIEGDQYVPGTVLDALESVSLFGAPNVFVLDTPSSTIPFWEEVQTHAPLLAQADTPFVVIEGALTAVQKRAFGKDVELTDISTTGSARFNTFALADALATRNKKLLWVGLQGAFRDGQDLAAIIGVLWWQLKTIRLARCTSSPEEAGLKSFPYQKAKRAQFSDAELSQLQFSLLQVYHQSRLGGKEGESSLEAWVLRV